MKKLLIFVIIMNFFLNGFGAIPAITTQMIRNQTNQTPDNQLFIPIVFPDFQSDWVQLLPEGQEITMNEFDHLKTLGCPLSTSKKPNTRFTTTGDSTLLGSTNRWKR